MSPVKKVKPPRWLKTRWLKWLSLALLIPLILCCLAIYTLVGTQPGSRWLVKYAVQKSPVEIQYQRLNGTLWEGLSLSSLQVNIAGEESTGLQTLKVESLAFTWDLRKLFIGTLKINSLDVGNIDIYQGINPAPEPFSSPTLPEFFLPFAINVKRLATQSINIYQAQQLTTTLPGVELSVTAYGKQLSIKNFLVTLNDINYRLSARLTNSAKPKLAINVPSHGIALDLQCSQRILSNCKGDLEWSEFSHPLVKPAAIPKGKLQLDWREPVLQIAGDIHAQWPDPTFGFDDLLHVDTHINLIEKQLSVSQLSGNWLGAKVDIAGDVSWQDGLAVNAKITTTTLHIPAPETYPDVSVSTTAHLTLGLQQGNLNLHINSDDLLINSGAQDIAANLDIHISPDKIAINTLQLTQAQQLITLKGFVDRQTGPHELTATLALQDLSQWLANSAGSLQGHVLLTGTSSNPTLNADLNAKDLQWQNLSLQKAHIVTTLAGKDLQPAADAMSLLTHIRLNTLLADVENVQLGNIDLQSLQATSSGTLAEAQLNANIRGLSVPGYDNPIHIAAIKVISSKIPAGFLLKIPSLELSEEGIPGKWTLDKKAEVDINPNKIALSDVCLNYNSANLCQQANVTKDKGTWHFELATSMSGLAINSAPPFLHNYLPRSVGEWQLDGVLQANAKATGAKSGDQLSVSLLNLQASLDKARIHSVATENKSNNKNSESKNNTEELTTEIPLQNISLSVDGDDQLVTVDGSIDFDAKQAIKLTGEARQWLSPQRSASLNLQGTTDELRIVQVWLPQLKNTKGLLATDVAVNLAAGNATPGITGTLTLTELSALIPASGTALTEWNINGSIDREAIRLSGEGLVGDQPAQLHGKVSIPPEHPEQWTVNAAVSGNNLILVNLPDQHLQASPNIAVSGDAKNIHVSGQIIIPKAQITITDLPQSAVQQSADARVYNENESAQNSDNLHYSASIDLMIEDEVNLSGYGLKTSLRGKLRLERDKNANTALQGVLVLPNGTYQKYGQDLIIENGRLMFTGNPQNPAFDIRAVRKIEDITVGIWLTGSAKNPKTQLFSSPTMGESDMLSYLLTGKPLSSDTSADESRQMQAAALNMGLNQILPGLRNITGKLGIDELSVDEATNGDSLISAGKWINDKLLVKYVYGVLDAVGKVVVQYHLTKNLRIETSSGEVQTADVIYTWNSPLPDVQAAENVKADTETKTEADSDNKQK